MRAAKEIAICEDRERCSTGESAKRGGMGGRESENEREEEEGRERSLSFL
jgi:hypothetical protein